MKKIVIFVVLFFKALHGEEASDDFNPEKAYQLISEENGILLDVRPLPDFLELHIENARRIECSELTSKFEDIIEWVEGDKNRPIIVYAQTMERGATAKKLLETFGFSRVVNLGLQHFWYEIIQK